MIDEAALYYKRGELIEFRLHLGGGTKTCHGLVLNTAVLFGKGARQLWIIEMENGDPEQKAHWLNKKHIVPEGDIVAIIPRVVIGADTILHQNPVSYPVCNAMGNQRETPAVFVSVPLPVTEKTSPEEPKLEETR